MRISDWSSDVCSSDLTRWGRRTPWIVTGSLVGGLCLFAVPQMTSLWAITLFWVGAVIALNSMQAALTTVVADRFAPSARGTASGFVGAGMTSGLTVGTIVAGLLAGPSSEERRVGKGGAREGRFGGAQNK